MESGVNIVIHVSHVSLNLPGKDATVLIRIPIYFRELEASKSLEQ